MHNSHDEDGTGRKRRWPSHRDRRSRQKESLQAALGKLRQLKSAVDAVDMESRKSSCNVSLDKNEDQMVHKELVERLARLAPCLEAQIRAGQLGHHAHSSSGLVEPDVHLKAIGAKHLFDGPVAMQTAAVVRKKQRGARQQRGKLQGAHQCHTRDDGDQDGDLEQDAGDECDVLGDFEQNAGFECHPYGALEQNAAGVESGVHGDLERNAGIECDPHGAFEQNAGVEICETRNFTCPSCQLFVVIPTILDYQYYVEAPASCSTLRAEAASFKPWAQKVADSFVARFPCHGHGLVLSSLQQRLLKRQAGLCQEFSAQSATKDAIPSSDLNTICENKLEDGVAGEVDDWHIDSNSQSGLVDDSSWLDDPALKPFLNKAERKQNVRRLKQKERRLKKSMRRERVEGDQPESFARGDAVNPHIAERCQSCDEGDMHGACQRSEDCDVGDGGVNQARGLEPEAAEIDGVSMSMDANHALSMQQNGGGGLWTAAKKLVYQVCKWWPICEAEEAQHMPTKSMLRRARRRERKMHGSAVIEPLGADDSWMDA